MLNVRILPALALAPVLASAAFAAGRPIVAVNEDNDHYFTTRGEEGMTVGALEAYIDRMAGGKVTHFFMCPSGQRPSYDSKVWEPIWTGLEEPGGATSRWGRNAKLLRDRGVDIYAVWIRRCRERGISPWLSPRMNDAHNADCEWPIRNTTFWRTRTDLHCNTNRFGRGVLNFAYDEVQDYTFALVREQLDRYDPDGMELDFMRFSSYFPHDIASNCTHHLDRFVKRVRDYVDLKSRERGHRVRLGVRVATRPQVARARGMDVGKWVREGWVDVVCASDGWRTPDYNMQAAEWRSWFGEAAGRVTLLAGCDHGVTAYSWNRTNMTPGFYAGFADVVWGNGFDGVYLFNAIYLDRVLGTVCAKGLFPEDLPAYRRRYPVSFLAETVGRTEEERQLPKLSDRENRFTVRLGARPVGEVSVFIGVLQEGDFSPEVTLNGVKAVSSKPSGMEVKEDSHPEKRQKYNGRRYFFPSSAVHPGADNVIELKPSETRMSIVWCEIMLEAVR